MIMGCPDMKTRITAAVDLSLVKQNSNDRYIAI